MRHLGTTDVVVTNSRLVAKNSQGEKKDENKEEYTLQANELNQKIPWKTKCYVWLKHGNDYTEGNLCNGTCKASPSHVFSDCPKFH